MTISRGLTCASLSGNQNSTLYAQAEAAASFVDLYEVRLDTMQKPDVAVCCKQLNKPLLFTNRAQWEGGNFDGTEKERILPLEQALQAGCAYIDIELKTEHHLRSSLISQAQKTTAKIIVSSHDFAGTPTAQELHQILEQMFATGADAGKIVTTATKKTEILRVLGLLEYAEKMKFPLSAFCMGNIGRISRLASIYLGAFMTYVAPGDFQETASGQFAAEHFHSLVQLFESNAN